MLDDSKTPEQKAEETEEAVQRWENNSPVESPPSYADYDKVCLIAHKKMLLAYIVVFPERFQEVKYFWV